MFRFLNYIRSCIWLWVLPLVASFTFWPNLGQAYQPAVFWQDIPQALGLIENISRVAVIGLSALLLLEWQTRAQKTGFVIYASGIVLYVLCQWAIVASPEGSWATSVFGFLAPAYTPAIWIIGIGLIGQRAVDDRLYWRNWVFFGVAGVFLVAHNVHAWLVFSRLG